MPSSTRTTLKQQQNHTKRSSNYPTKVMTNQIMGFVLVLIPFVAMIQLARVFLCSNINRTYGASHFEFERAPYSNTSTKDYGLPMPIKRTESNVDSSKFILASPFDGLIDKNFTFDASDYTYDDLQLNRRWVCIPNDTDTLSNNRPTKFVFLHMHRSAGSTVRAIFKGFGNFCVAGIAFVDNCIDLRISSIDEKLVWMNRMSRPASRKPCRLSYAASRDKKILSTFAQNDSMVSTALLKYLNVDILAGQLSVGCIENLGYTDVQYITFFREPLSKLVSELIQHENLKLGNESESSFEQIINSLKATVDDHLNRLNDNIKYHEKYSSYLITQEQHAWVDKNHIMWTPRRRVNMALRNLYSSRVLVGIVENMTSSIELLRFVLDESNQVESLFQFFHDEKDLTKLNGQFATNFVTENVVAEIQKDRPFLLQLKEYLKYEYEIYEHALRIHAIQFLGIQESR